MIRNVLSALVLLTALFVACDLGDDGTGPVVYEPVATILVVEPESHLFDALGDSVRFEATVLDEDGNAIEGAVVAWTSGAPGVATVDDDGWVVARAGGATWIVAKFEESRTRRPSKSNSRRRTRRIRGRIPTSWRVSRSFPTRSGSSRSMTPRG